MFSFISFKHYTYMYMLALLLLIASGMTNCQNPMSRRDYSHKIDYRIVWIELSDDHTLEDLLALNLYLDVWEVGKQYAVARATDSTILALRQNGYSTVILYPTINDYYTSVASGYEPLRVARVNCRDQLECLSLSELGLVSGFIEQHENYAIVKLTEQQLVIMLEKGYNTHLLYATEQEYLSSLKVKEDQR
jgi:hypothetical protein